MALCWIAAIVSCPVILFLLNRSIVNECLSSFLAEINLVDASGFINKGRSEAFVLNGGWDDFLNHLGCCKKNLKRQKQKVDQKVEKKLNRLKLKTGHEKIGGTI
jgi:hypothetical protein